MEEEAKAIQEVAKTAGKALDATRELGGFASRFVAGPLEVVSGIIEDRLRYVRWERQARLILRANQFLKDAGLAQPTKPIPLKIAIPLLEGAALEDDDDLQDRWAQLLVNAADADSGVEVRRVHIAILEELSPLDALILDKIYALPLEQARARGVATAGLPGFVRVLHDQENPKEMPSDDVALSLGNLIRLGCLKDPTTWEGGEYLALVFSTVLGSSFVAACQSKRVIPDVIS